MEVDVVGSSLGRAVVRMSTEEVVVVTDSSSTGASLTAMLTSVGVEAVAGVASEP